MKRLIALLLTLLMITSLAPISFAEPSKTPLTISVATVQGRPGDTVTVPITIDTNPGIIGLSFEVNYDRDSLILSDFYNGEALAGSDVFFASSPSFASYPYELVWMCPSEVNLTGTGTLATLHFTIKSEPADSAPVTLTFRECYNANFDSITDVIINNGAVNVSTSYTVTFIDWNGKVLSTQQVNYGESAVAPEPPTRPGYIFTGWDKDFTNVMSDLTVTALYTPEAVETHTVTFLDWNDTVLSTQEVNHGESAVAPDAPIREGYEFIGWDTDFTVITSDLTITAQYEVSTHIVTFVDGLTSEVISTQIVNHGENAEIPVAPVHDGYEFIGWDGDGLNITSNTTITAQYKSLRIPYDVNNDGAVNTGDAVIVLRYIAGLTELDEGSLIAADATGDGSVNAGDAVMILRFIAGLDPKNK